MAMAVLSLNTPFSSLSASLSSSSSSPSSSSLKSSSCYFRRPFIHCCSFSLSLIPLSPTLILRTRRFHTHLVRMAPEEEKMTRRSPLDFPIEWERPKPGRRPDIFPQFSPMKTPLPPPLPADPPEEDEEEEEKKEEEEEDPEKEETDKPQQQW